MQNPSSTSNKSTFWSKILFKKALSKFQSNGCQVRTKIKKLKKSWIQTLNNQQQLKRAQKIWKTNDDFRKQFQKSKNHVENGNTERQTQQTETN